MPLVLIVPAFVTAAMYLRRHFGGGALAALWVLTSAAMTVTSSAHFMALLSRVGTSVSSAGRTLATAFMFYLMAISFGTSALAIHRRQTKEGPWLTTGGFLMGVMWFVVGGATAYAIAALTIILVVSQMAP